jgi:osmotically-inducible protein OsmY
MNNRLRLQKHLEFSTAERFPRTALSCAAALGGLLFLAACREMNQGTVGTADVETGVGQASAVGPYQNGQPAVFTQSGSPDQAIAAMHAQAELEASGAGVGELERRSTAAEAGNPGAAGITSDRTLLENIQSALNSVGPENSSSARAFSIEQLNNLHITAKNGVVTLRGLVPSVEEKQEIEARVRSVPGIRSIDNELQVVRHAQIQP